MPLSNSNTSADTDVKCATLRTVLGRIGDKWSLYVLDHLHSRPKRFNEIKRGIDGISQRMLTLTLRSLERDGLVLRNVQSTKPVQVDYLLTELGHSLLGSVKALICWTETHWEDIHHARSRFDDAGEPEAFVSYYRDGKRWLANQTDRGR